MIVFEILSYAIAIAFWPMVIYYFYQRKKGVDIFERFKRNNVEKEKVIKEKRYDRLDMTHIDGLDNIQKKQDCKVDLYADRVNIIVTKDMQYNIKNESIKGMSIVLAKDLLDKNKSSVLRGAVGSMLAGPGGLILGGMSGMKTGKKSVYVLIVNYISKSNEEKSIMFAPKYNKVLTENFIKKFEKLNNRSMRVNTEL